MTSTVLPFLCTYKLQSLEPFCACVDRRNERLKKCAKLWSTTKRNEFHSRTIFGYCTKNIRIMFWPETGSELMNVASLITCRRIFFGFFCSPVLRYLIWLLCKLCSQCNFFRVRDSIPCGSAGADLIIIVYLWSLAFLWMEFDTP